MNWLEILNTIFNVAIIPLIIAASGLLIAFISAKTKQIKEKTESDTVDKYLGMLEDTITKAVIATTQTYVEALKNKNAFDEEAQKEAFKKTYDAVIAVLTEDAKKYLVEAVGDLESYITTRIEYNVKVCK
jgi:predicted Holliday junction resolvase-like endonuclease